jgi:hypothetical protein
MPLKTLSHLLYPFGVTVSAEQKQSVNEHRHPQALERALRHLQLGELSRKLALACIHEVIHDQETPYETVLDLNKLKSLGLTTRLTPIDVMQTNRNHLKAYANKTSLHCALSLMSKLDESPQMLQVYLYAMCEVSHPQDARRATSLKNQTMRHLHTLATAANDAAIVKLFTSLNHLIHHCDFPYLLELMTASFAYHDMGELIRMFEAIHESVGSYDYRTTHSVPFSKKIQLCVRAIVAEQENRQITVTIIVMFLRNKALPSMELERLDRALNGIIVHPNKILLPYALTSLFQSMNMHSRDSIDASVMQIGMDAILREQETPVFMADMMYHLKAVDLLPTESLMHKIGAHSNRSQLGVVLKTLAHLASVYKSIQRTNINRRMDVQWHIAEWSLESFKQCALAVIGDENTPHETLPLVDRFTNLLMQINAIALEEANQYVASPMTVLQRVEQHAEPHDMAAIWPNIKDKVIERMQSQDHVALDQFEDYEDQPVFMSFVANYGRTAARKPPVGLQPQQDNHLIEDSNRFFAQASSSRVEVLQVQAMGVSPSAGGQKLNS